jgi:hypothetical protein
MCSALCSSTMRDERDVPPGRTYPRGRKIIEEGRRIDACKI